MMNSYPAARYNDIVVQELGEETLVYDMSENRAFCLNRTAGEAWKMCDGKTSVAAMARALSLKLKTNVSEEFVIFSLGELRREGLLEETENSTEDLYQGLSRREAIRRAGLASMVALPMITALAAPLAAHAQSSCVALSGACTFNNGTQSNCCTNLRCGLAATCVNCFTTGTQYGTCGGDVTACSAPVNSCLTDPFRNFCCDPAATPIVADLGNNLASCQCG